VRSDADDGFDSFVALHEPRLRRALVAAYESQRGREGTAEALSWAWENWGKAAALGSPVPYLFRVGRSRTRARKARPVFDIPLHHEPRVEPKLRAALEALTEHQRVAVVLVHGYGWTMREVAELDGIAVTTVQNHLDRALRKLRAALEVYADE
jgi:DNA-directed RNA polymerase specialized sigma24 family protein